MSQQPTPAEPLSPEERSLRRMIALALLFSPTMCVLPLLAFVAGGSGLRWIIWGLWAIIGAVLVTVIWRAAARLRALAAERAKDILTTRSDV